LDGNQGSMLVGGEFPVPIASGTSGTITIEYKPFGVQLNVSPIIVGDGLVQLTVNPEVSTLDFGNAVQLSGTTIPALTVRRATTTLQMRDGQTLVIGGLYSSTNTKNVQRIPLLSQIPVIGEFFKSTSTTKQETELVVLIETEIVNPETTEGVQPAPPGSLENMPIEKPYLRRHEFDKDFPELQKIGPEGNPEAPKTPINLPLVPAAPSGK
jgi:pilus assembly protein CpaC